MMNPNKIQDLNKLIELIYQPVPKFKEIEKSLQSIHPALISLEIEKDVGFAYMLDYYLRIIDPKVVYSIINNPMFSDKALIELFYCNIGSIQKSVLLDKKPPEILSSYWKNLSKQQFAILLKNTIQRTWFLDPAKNLLQSIDLIHIKMLIQSGKVESSSVLNLFREMGPKIKKLFSEDINFYDYVFNLANQESDDEFLKFLEDYTIVFVQLRIASSFVQEMNSLLLKNSKVKPDYSELFQLFNQVPTDSLAVTLELFREKEWLTDQEMYIILDSFLNKKHHRESNT